MIVLIYIEKITPRLTYVCDLIFKQYFGVNYEFTLDKDRYFQGNLPRLNYSGRELVGDDLFIPSTGLLNERGISEKKITVFEYKKLPAFFQSQNPAATFPFDMFSAIFYLVSRYEEYLPFEPDEHGRFTARQSLAFRGGFLRIPLVDKWVALLRSEMSKRYPQLVMKAQKYRFKPTYDVDMAWSYLGKGAVRIMGAVIKELAKGDWRGLKERFGVLAGRKKDPFDVFAYLESLSDKYGLEAKFFFLMGKYGEFDKNISPKNEKFRDLIRRIRQKGYPIGIHPSYAGGAREETLAEEIKNLQEIMGAEVTASRHHFLKIRFPGTFRLLIKSGIKTDYSLGYAEDIGFRASIARPFYWYDISSEQITGLKLLPFEVMDVSLREYLKLSPEEAIEQVREIIDETKEVGGVFVTLWHNSSFSVREGWEGWETVYEEILKHAL